MLLTVPFCYVFLPPITPDDDGPDLKERVSLGCLLRIPAVWVVCGCVFVGAVGWSILDPTLAPHLEKVSATQGVDESFQTYSSDENCVLDIMGYQN